VETKISHLRLLQPGPLTGVGRVIRRGRAIAFLEAQVTAADNALTVLASSTWSLSR
jgi:acyl-coenzyme A thioesterase PaaI-like protein